MFGYGLWRLHDFRFRIGGGIGKCCTHGITHGAVRLINFVFLLNCAAKAASDLGRPFGPEERSRQGSISNRYHKAAA
jgi:hypothetical protein